jgi:hypothetical protein
MEKFLNEIYRVFFDVKMNKHKKNQLFLSIMQTYQNELWENFKIYLDY